MNFGSLTTSGIDLGASYAFDSVAGHFAADSKGTWIDQYEALDLPGQAPTDRVNVANSVRHDREVARHRESRLGARRARRDDLCALHPEL